MNGVEHSINLSVVLSQTPNVSYPTQTIRTVCQIGEVSIPLHFNHISASQRFVPRSDNQIELQQ